MNKIRRFFTRHYLTILVIVGLLALAIILYTYGSRTFLTGTSAAEKQIVEQSSTLSAIVKNPLWIVYKLAVFTSLKLGAAEVSLRFISAFFAIISVYAFYSLANKWYSQRVSVLTTVLFALSVTTLTVSRIATPAVLLYSWMAYFANIAWFKSTRRVRLAPLVVLVTTGGMLYIPGAVWFLLLIALWFWKDIPRIFKHMSRSWITIGSVLGIAILTPLVYSIINDTSLLRSWLLLPQKIDLSASIRALKDIPAAFFYRSAINPAYNLGRLPLFDAFTGTMLLLGLFAYRTKLRLERSIVYILSVLVSFLLVSINANQLYLILCVPFLYLLVGEGISYLLNEWRFVFPRNPIARFVGTLLLSIAVFGVCSYHMNRYFLAWVNAPETKHVYSEPPTKQITK